MLNLANLGPKTEASLATWALGKIRKKSPFMQTFFLVLFKDKLAHIWNTQGKYPQVKSLEAIHLWKVPEKKIDKNEYFFLAQKTC